VTTVEVVCRKLSCGRPHIIISKVLLAALFTTLHLNVTMQLYGVRNARFTVEVINILRNQVLEHLGG
jgi:hypothetical protein